ncbi:hypothetical protein NPIL_459491 [Nephila pilipes]|uniref:Uncharacterized protein n=1 Tax=Nephila pilipes TaxID=299642 RepID=A0A8X6NNT9_NEPPI|nr:hypothetical protein NPIL_459491 [Nephila pilipes]
MGKTILTTYLTFCDRFSHERVMHSSPVGSGQTGLVRLIGRSEARLLRRKSDAVIFQFCRPPRRAMNGHGFLIKG